MNNLLRTLADAGLSQLLYDIFFVLGFVTVFIFIVWYGKKLNLKMWQSVGIVLIAYPVLVLWMFVLYWMESGFRNFGGNNIVRVFVYIPIVAYFVGKLLKISWKKINSVLAFAPLVVHGTSHFGCIFVGCCTSYPTSWGLYNVDMGDIRFPNQPLEALTAWLIIGYLLYRAKRTNYELDGLEMPTMLILFGSTRFLFEFLRDNEKIWLGCSSLAFHALFMFIAGVIMYIVTKKKLVAGQAAAA